MAGSESPETPVTVAPGARRAGTGRHDGGRSAGHDASVAEYLGVLQKRKVAAVAAFLVVFVPWAAYTLIQPSIFEAGARLMIQPAAASPISFGDNTRADTPQQSFETQAETIVSRTVALKTIQNLKLWTSRAFMAPDVVASPMAALRWAYDSTVGALRGRPSGGSSAPAGDQAAALVDTLLARLSVRPVENSRLVDVVVASQDAKLAAAMANEYARLAVEQDLESRFEAARHATDWLDKRLAEQRAAVDASEAALQRYREEHGLASLDDRQNIVVQRLADLNAAVTRARTERISKEGLYNQLRALQDSRASLDTFPVIQGNPYIQQLKAQVAALQKEQSQLAERYGDRHPEMVRVRTAQQAAEAQLQSEIAKSVEAVRNDFLTARAQEQSLTGALEGQKRLTLDQQRVGIEYASLQRDATSNQQVLDSLLQQTKETGLEAAVRSTNIRIVEQAVVPLAPARPQRVRGLLLSLLGASLIALAVVFTLEQLDTRLKTPEEMRTYLDVPVLGMVPTVEPKDLDHSVPLVGRHSSPDFSEALRRVRTNLMLSAGRDQVKTLAITSTNPREGKTVIASNTAVILAQAGRRVLLIDADMRRPQVHEVFDVPQSPGLSGVLVGKSRIEDCLHLEAVPGLDVLAAGSLPPNPAELLALPVFGRLLGDLTGQYDHIIIDCPPIMAVTDASLVASVVSGVVFVVGADATPRAAARIALDELRASHETVIGAVLNRVDLQRNRYYYSRYYRPDYQKYYRRA